MNSRRISFVMLLGVAAGACLAAAACSSSEGKETVMPAPRVAVMEVSAQDVPVYNEYAGQTYARDLVEVRGRVDGYVEKRLFQVGADVKPGQPLYILDLRPSQAAVQKARGDVAESEANLEFAQRQVALVQAEADLAQAQANLLKARHDVERLRPLVR
ncbi:MAG: efflux RND transporter periplasmic adaptor subunit, partial [Gammaproteobacteria bacterium]